jgi:regulator of sirC expression with transglutaminase-like and TPR domain
MIRRGIRTQLLLVGLLISLCSGRAWAQQCLGDCNGNGSVSASELTNIIGLINCCPCSGALLGGAPGGCSSTGGCQSLFPSGLPQCTAADGKGNGCITAGELTGVIADRYGYRGDTLTYEDLQNANLMRVIDRRKGLPVALGILYIHAARAQGWDAAGLAFPGHFLLRLAEGGQSLIIDPFHEGRARDAAALRELLKTIAGSAAELEPAHYAEASDRDVLLRLQNNLKQRLLQGRRFEEALGVIEGMLLFAPDHAALWQEAGLVNAECGNLRAAMDALERALALCGDEAQRHRTAMLLQQLKARLQ